MILVPKFIQMSHNGIPLTNFINPSTILLLTLIIEAINSVDAGTFMVPSEEKEILWVLDLISEQETYCLQWLLAPVDVIAEEEIIGIRGIISIVEKTKQVSVLAMYISCHVLW